MYLRVPLRSIMFASSSITFIVVCLCLATGTSHALQVNSVSGIFESPDCGCIRSKAQCKPKECIRAEMTFHFDDGSRTYISRLPVCADNTTAPTTGHLSQDMMFFSLVGKYLSRIKFWAIINFVGNATAETARFEIRNF